MNTLTRFLFIALPVIWISGCTSLPPSRGAGEGTGSFVTGGSRQPASAETSARRSRYAGPEDTAGGFIGLETERKARSEAPSSLSRPGLATTAGYVRWSAVSNAAFYRKPFGQPDAVDSFHYNDEVGAKAMADALGGGTRRFGAFEAAHGLIRVGLGGNDGWRYWPRLEAKGRRIVVGEPGRSYSIVLKNETKQRLEVVASVDGLDVMDGGTASVKKRGYVLDPRAELSIDGFRASPHNVKTFIFGSVGESEAAKKGSARNVGVIGLAVYEEDLAAATAAQLAEAQKRGGASAFPNR